MYGKQRKITNLPHVKWIARMEMLKITLPHVEWIKRDYAQNSYGG